MPSGLKLSREVPSSHKELYPELIYSKLAPKRRGARILTHFLGRLQDHPHSFPNFSGPHPACLHRMTGLSCPVAPTLDGTDAAGGLAAGSEARKAGCAAHFTQARAVAQSGTAGLPGKGKSGLFTRLLPTPLSPALLCRAASCGLMQSTLGAQSLKRRFGREEGLPGVAQAHCQSEDGGQGKSCHESEGP